MDSVSSFESDNSFNSYVAGVKTGLFLNNRDLGNLCLVFGSKDYKIN